LQTIIFYKNHTIITSTFNTVTNAEMRGSEGKYADVKVYSRTNRPTCFTHVGIAGAVPNISRITLYSSKVEIPQAGQMVRIIPFPWFPSQQQTHS
jgi:hypothetical protein